MYLVPGVYLVLGGVPARGVTAWGVYLPWGACLPGGMSAGGMYARGGMSARGEFLTHAYENITLPQTSFAGSNKKEIKSIVIDMDFPF